MLSVQVYIYSQHFKDDKKWMKALVYSLYILEIVQTILTTVDAFEWFAIGFGNMISLSKPRASSVDSPMMDAIIGGVVQLFFCWRIWNLSKSKILVGILCLIAVVQCAGGVIAGVRSIIINNVVTMRQSQIVYLSLTFGGSALVDTMIALAMTWLLLKHKNTMASGGFAPTTNKGGDAFSRIVRLIIETNTLTATFAITSFVLFLASPTTSLFMIPPYALGKLYSNTLLVVFNNRIFLGAKPAHNGENYSNNGTGHPVKFQHDAQAQFRNAHSFELRDKKPVYDIR